MASRFAPAVLRRLGLALALMLAGTVPAMAQSLLRDAGMEHGLNLIARPILVAAGLPSRSTRVLIVNDPSLNAFVVDSRTIFIHSGLFLRLRSAAQLQAVIAHEVAHIANGHFARRRMNAASSRTVTGLGVLMGLAVGVAADNPGIGAGLIAGTAGSARGVFMGHTRAEETAADRSGMRYLAAAGIDPGAMRGVLDLFALHEDLNFSPRPSTGQSHPLTTERIRAAEEFLSLLSVKPTNQATADYWFARAQGKLGAYLRPPRDTLAHAPRTRDDDAAIISRAMAYFRIPDLAAARREMAILLDRLPEDAYVQELAGWFEIENGNAPAALPYLARASDLAPDEPLILAGYGRALLALDTPEGNRKALDTLETARARDPADGRLLRDLSVAYARAGNDGMAALSTAERYALAGRLNDAGIHAGRALGLLPVGSPGWARAEDIKQAAKTVEKRR
ncbi:MAG: M48 family metalloprotease [Qingshengfaniella sp.]